MNRKYIPDETINSIAEHINSKTSQPPLVKVESHDGIPTSPHYYEIVPFNEIDHSKQKFFAIDGSYNSQEFYNGIHIGIYTAGYVCYHEGKQIRMNTGDDPVILGQAYFPENILITNEQHRTAIFDELFTLAPVQQMIKFCDAKSNDDILGMDQKGITSSVSKLLAFCQEILEWSLVLEILNSAHSSAGDFILRDGALRSVNIKQEYITKLGELAREKEVYLIAITKKSPIKLELSSSFREIDAYLEKEKKPSYPFTITNKSWQKICCWLEVPDNVLLFSYPAATERSKSKPERYSMFAHRNLTGGRGFGLFFVARLDYVEKLQNYDWVVVDINIFDAIPEIHVDMDESQIKGKKRDIEKLKYLFKELTRLTQEHYILGYPYPLVEAHNFVTLKDNFKDEVVKRVKASLYLSEQLDNVDIENIFLDIHDKF